MRLVLKSNRIESFKNITDSSLKFYCRTHISGANGIGKTTQADAFTWLMTNTDSKMHSNPLVKPIGSEEANTVVTENFELDFKPLTLTKSQKTTNSKGKISTTNSYEINSVPKTEKAFKEFLELIGIDLELLPSLVHIEAFMSKKPEDRRNILFKMAKDITDIDIIRNMGNSEELKNLAELYSVEEIKAMNKSAITKINKDYGKDGEILRAKIEGAEKLFVTVPDNTELISEKEAEKRKLNELLELCEETQNKIVETKDEILKLQFEKNELGRKEEEEVQKKLMEVNNACISLEAEINSDEKIIALKEETLREIVDFISKCKSDWIEVRDSSFNTDELVCPVCHREFDEAKKEEVLANYEYDKKVRLAEITELGKKNCMKRDALNKEIVELKSKVTKLRTELTCYEGKKNSIKRSDWNSNSEYNSYQRKIGGLQSKVNRLTEELNKLNPNDVADRYVVISDVIKALTDEPKFAEASNERVAKQIAEYREMQRNFEKEKANAEKILFQIEEFEKKKNELLEESINSNFKLVKFKLWETYKNGEYKPCCTPMYAGKDINVSTNNGLELLMKLDIINGLQNYFDMHLPVFVDNAECLSSDSLKMIRMDTQLIFLSVSEDKELKVENK